MRLVAVVVGKPNWRSWSLLGIASAPTTRARAVIGSVNFIVKAVIVIGRIELERG
jgi:hypothetical protein